MPPAARDRRAKLGRASNKMNGVSVARPQHYTNPPRWTTELTRNRASCHADAPSAGPLRASDTGHQALFACGVLKVMRTPAPRTPPGFRLILQLVRLRTRPPPTPRLSTRRSSALRAHRVLCASDEQRPPGRHVVV